MQIMNRQNPKTCRLKYAPVRYLDRKQAHEFYDPLNKWVGEGVDLQWIKNATLLLNEHIAIATAILFPLHIAILRSHHNI